MRPSQIISVLEREFEAAAGGQHTPVMLWGPPGVGKSDLVRQVGLGNDVAVIDLRLSQLEPSDLRGIPFRSGELVEWAIPATLPNAKRHGDRGVLFLDEINAAPPSVSAAAYQLILDRRLGEYHVPDGWAIFAAGNRQGDRGIAYAMPTPLANRFSHYEVTPNLEDWCDWAFQRGIDHRLIAFLRFRPDLLFEFDAARNPTAFPSPRTWEFAHRALQKFGHERLLCANALQACVGDAAGIEAAAFIDNLDQLPDIDAIANGSSEEIPEGIELQYAVASALVKRAVSAQQKGDGSDISGNILNYARLLPQREIGVMLVIDMHRHIGPDICQLSQFADWAEEMAHVILPEVEA
jgi:hypothetical protein